MNVPAGQGAHGGMDPRNPKSQVEHSSVRTLTYSTPKNSSPIALFMLDQMRTRAVDWVCGTRTVWMSNVSCSDRPHMFSGTSSR